MFAARNGFQVGGAAGAQFWNDSATNRAAVVYVGLGDNRYQMKNAAANVQANTDTGGGALSNPTGFQSVSTSPTPKWSQYGYSYAQTANSAIQIASVSTIPTDWSWVRMWVNPRAGGGQHFIGNGDCTTRFLLDGGSGGSLSLSGDVLTLPSGWTYIAYERSTGNMYGNGSLLGSSFGRSNGSNLFCSWYFGWSNSNTLPWSYNDYIVYGSGAVFNPTVVPTQPYYLGGLTS